MKRARAAGHKAPGPKLVQRRTSEQIALEVSDLQGRIAIAWQVVESLNTGREFGLVDGERQASPESSYALLVGLQAVLQDVDAGLVRLRRVANGEPASAEDAG